MGSLNKFYQEQKPRVITIETVNEAARLLRTLRMAGHKITIEGLIGARDYSSEDNSYRNKYSALDYLLFLGQIVRSTEYRAPKYFIWYQAI